MFPVRLMALRRYLTGLRLVSVVGNIAGLAEGLRGQL